MHGARWGSKALPPTNTSFVARVTLSPTTAAGSATSNTGLSREIQSTGERAFRKFAAQFPCTRWPGCRTRYQRYVISCTETYENGRQILRELVRNLLRAKSRNNRLNR